MKISFLIDTLSIHGSVRRCINFANALTSRGHEVAIYHEHGEPCAWLRVLAPIRPVIEILDSCHDVVILMTNNGGYLKLANRTEVGLKVFYLLGLDETNLDAIKAEGLGENGKTFFRRIVKASDWRIMANSTWMYEWMRENLRPDIKLLLGGVDRSIFYPMPAFKALNFPSTLSTGGIREREGSGTVKEALLIVLKKYPELKFEAYDKKGYPQNQMARIYSSATIFVDGQWYAGWNNAVIEAMACGTPVCCTDIGGVEDFAFHNETALLSPVQDANAMAENVLRLLVGGEALRLRLSEAAYEVSKRFDWAASAERFEELVREWK